MTTYDNFTGKQQHGFYSWSPKIPFTVPDATFTRAYFPVTMFINYNNGNTKSSIASVRLKLCAAGIYMNQCP